MKGFNIFTKHLVELFKQEFNASEKTYSLIRNFKEYYEISNFFNESEDLKKNITDIDSSQTNEDLEWENECLEDTIKDLNADIKDLKDEISELKNYHFNTETWWDEEKFKTFLKYHGNFNPFEFEELLSKK